MPTYRKKCVVDGCRKFAINEVGVANPVLRCRIHEAGLEPPQAAQEAPPQPARKIRKRCATQGCRGFAINDEGVQNPTVHCRRCGVENPAGAAPPPDPGVSRLTRPQECPICYEANQLVALRPCGHWCCMTCVSRLEQPVCPFCRANLDMPNANPGRRARRGMMHRPSQAGRQQEAPVVQIERRQRPRRDRGQLSQEEWINRLLDFVTAINAMRPLMTPEDFIRQQQIANRYVQNYAENFANSIVGLF
jgi:hypothetical protein